MLIGSLLRGKRGSICTTTIAGQRRLLRAEADALRVLHDPIGGAAAASAGGDADSDWTNFQQLHHVTAHDANMRGFDIYIPPDCSCARNAEEHAQSLAQLEAMAGANLGVRFR